jgi:hypothetical protein
MAHRKPGNTTVRRPLLVFGSTIWSLPFTRCIARKTRA